MAKEVAGSVPLPSVTKLILHLKALADGNHHPADTDTATVWLYYKWHCYDKEVFGMCGSDMGGLVLTSGTGCVRVNISSCIERLSPQQLVT